MNDDGGADDGLAVATFQVADETCKIALATPSLHIDPASLEFANMTTEVGDGLPSFVENGTVTSDQYCPWSAEVIAVDDP